MARTLEKRDTQLLLRIDEGLKRQLTELAKQNNRTVTGEINIRLENSLVTSEAVKTVNTLSEDDMKRIIDKEISGRLRIIENYYGETKRDIAKIIAIIEAQTKSDKFD